MDERQDKQTPPVNPRRRKRSQVEIFKEAYLPAIIACVALLLILIFIIGSIARGINNRNAEAAAKQEASVSLQQEQERLAQEVADLIADADLLAKQYDYTGAIALLDSFDGNAAQFPQLAKKREAYANEQKNMVLWNDPGQVVNLSFQLLIADTHRAFTNATYGNAYNRNFVTTEEFSKILQQLYDNGYILIRVSDIIEEKTDEDGTTLYAAKDLYLPAGKKPLLLTQTNVNYNTYMIDGDGDRFPDKDGAGFASKLVFDEDGKLTCEMVDGTGKTVRGAFDLVPILDAFVEENPDFSYQGAKAILAVTGYDGLFGYRTNAKAQDYFGVAVYEQEIADVKHIIDALRNTGYQIACYTYENTAYGNRTAAEVKADLSGWTAEVAPILGGVDMLVYAQNSDISSNSTAYTGEVFNALQDTGFRYYLGFCDEGNTWASVNDDYVRLGRILVTGSNMAHRSSWFSGIFDAASVLDKTRGTVPG